jgi:hypothetical protein
MLVTISHDAARVLRTSPSLVRTHVGISAAVRVGALIDGHWRFTLSSRHAVVLRAWCLHQADTLRQSSPTTATLLASAAGDIQAAVDAGAS